MDLPHIHLEGRTGVKIYCMICKKEKDFDTTGRTEKQINEITENYTCPCLKKIPKGAE